MTHTFEKKHAIYKDAYKKGVFLVPCASKKEPFVEGWTKGLSFDVFIHNANTNANFAYSGVVCGELSKILCYDVDVKNLNVVDDVISGLRKSFSHLKDRLVIESTPSGGLHVWYRVSLSSYPGNKKIANFQEEVDGKKKKRNFIETRGEGGQFVSYPSDNYIVLDIWDGDVEVANLDGFPFPDEISGEDYACLHSFFKSFDRMPEQIQRPVIVKRAESGYTKSPFEDYNNRGDVLSILENKGWVCCGEDSTWVRLTRPGKSSGVSASYHKGFNSLYVFTSSTDFDPSEWYSACDIALMYKYGNDSKAMFSDIKDSFGVLNDTAARKALKRSLKNQLAVHSHIDYSQLPAVIPKEIIEDSKEEIAALTTQYPFGVFWVETESTKDDTAFGIMIDRTRLYEILDRMGYRIYFGRLVVISQNPHCKEAGCRFVRSTTIAEINSELKLYSGETGLDTTIRNSIDTFVQHNFAHVSKNLTEIRASEYISDTQKSFVRFFRNCWIVITTEGIKCNKYSELPQGLIHIDKYINFDYKDWWIPMEDGYFSKFLEKATAKPAYAMRAFSYLAHDYKTTNGAVMIGLVESATDERRMGGSGKNVFIGLLSQLSPVSHISAESIKLDTTMLQSWNVSRRVVSFDDTPKNFNYLALRELVSGSAIVKNLFKDIREYSHSELPKICFNSNFPVALTNGSLRRRTRLVEFTDFFNIAGGVGMYFYQQENELKKYHRGMKLPDDYRFPDDRPLSLSEDFREQHSKSVWTDDDWMEFFYIAFMSMHEYFLSGATVPVEEITEQGWEKHFAGEYSSAFDMLQECFSGMVESDKMANDVFYDKYVIWCATNGILPQYRISAKRFVSAVREYAGRMGYDLLEGISAGGGKRGKVLVKKGGSDDDDA